MPASTTATTTVMTRVWRPAWPCPVGQICGALRHGGGDPTYRVDPDGTIWRGILTPAGPATLMIRSRPADGEVEAHAWGDGAGWALDQVPEMLGARDDCSAFVAHHPPIAEAWRRHPHWRVPRGGLVMESLVPAIIEQKVTGKEAFAGWRALVRRFGTPAPGPFAAERRLFVMPSPERITKIPSWEWLQLHIDPARSRTVVTVARSAAAIERTIDLPHDEADRRLRSIPGVGVWTSAETRARAHGDPDAVSFGDYHVAKDIGWALTGEPVDDEGLATLLEPYRGHRLRVQVLVGMAGLRRPRHGPRMSVPTHYPGGPPR